MINTHIDNITLKFFSNVLSKVKGSFLCNYSQGGRSSSLGEPQQTIIDYIAGCPLFFAQMLHSGSDQVFTQGTATQPYGKGKDMDF